MVVCVVHNQSGFAAGATDHPEKVQIAHPNQEEGMGYLQCYMSVALQTSHSGRLPTCTASDHRGLRTLGQIRQRATISAEIPDEFTMQRCRPCM